MKLVKKLHIEEIHATTCTNALYKLILRHEANHKCELILNKAACKRHGINPTLGLTGRTLECTLTARKLREKSIPSPSKEKWSLPDDQDVKIDEVWLGKIIRTEKYEQHQGMAIANQRGLYQTVTHILYAESDDGGGGSHLYIPNCPLYSLVVHLTKEEYNECVKLPQGTVLKTQFRLLPKEKPQKEAKSKAMKK